MQCMSYVVVVQESLFTNFICCLLENSNINIIKENLPTIIYIPPTTSFAIEKQNVKFFYNFYTTRKMKTKKKTNKLYASEHQKLIYMKFTTCRKV